MRWNQTWKCIACGHKSFKTVSYPKIGGYWVEVPLSVYEARARCTQCGVRGRCHITEAPASAPTWADRAVRP